MMTVVSLRPVLEFFRTFFWWLVLSLLSLVVGVGGEKEDVAAVVPLSVNYHFTRQCNYSCGFCFHTAKTSFVLPLEKAKQGPISLTFSS